MSKPDRDELLRLERSLEQARRELLETSTRSRLLHTPLGTQWAKIIEVHDALAEQVFRILVREGRSMTFRTAPDRATESDDSELELPQPVEDQADQNGDA